MLDRRTLLAAAALLAAGCRPRAPAAAPPAAADARFEAIRATLGPGARLGVAAIEAGSRRRLLHDASARYAMASTFKLPLAAAILALADRGALRLDEELPFAAGDPLPNSPVIEANLARGRLAVEALCAAIIERSDNSAANMLLRRLGGPGALTRFARGLGDDVTRLDRYELELNSNLPGDPRDTTSPTAMAGLVLAIAGALEPNSRARLVRWLEGSVPGPDRLRAGFPPGWRFGHKTGTGANGAFNDVGIGWPPDRPPIVVASYQDGGDAAPAVRAAAHASVARLVAERFG